MSYLQGLEKEEQSETIESNQLIQGLELIGVGIILAIAFTFILSAIGVHIFPGKWSVFL